MDNFLRSLCIYFISLQFVSSFNLDTHVPIVKSGNKGSYFGFSVAQHIVEEERLESGQIVTDHHYVTLVGAPKDNVTVASSPTDVRTVSRPGAVHKCAFSSYQDDCQQLELMLKEPQKNNDGNAEEDRTDQWLGVSVASTGTPGGLAMACAHRWKKVSYKDQNTISAIWGPGMCVNMYNSLDEENLYDVCSYLSTDRGHQDYGFCQSGISATASEDSDNLVGAAGVYTWRGMVAKNHFYTGLGVDQKMYMNHHVDWAPPQQPIMPDTHYFSYLGMSTAIGKLIGNKATYVSGAPRSNETGQVLLFHQDQVEEDLERKAILNGDQFGSYFGHSLAVADFNGDGLEDLAVGAPFYTDDEVGGAIYIYLANQQGISSETVPTKITSPGLTPGEKRTQTQCKQTNCHNGRFGFSLARVGDVDMDGYQDLAVGAPFEGDGTIYIYRGSQAGLITDFSQRIPAEEVATARPLETFGYSLSGGIDMDQNTYPDLVVGAYKSDKILILRSRPVVNVTVLITSTPTEIDPNSEDRCTSSGHLCFNLHVCFKFTAKPRDVFTGGIKLDYRIEAETFIKGTIKSRVNFKCKNCENRHIIERSSELYPQTDVRCKDEPHEVIIQKGNRDFLRPINFQLTYKLGDNYPPIMNPGDAIPDINTYPVLDSQKTTVLHSVEFKKNCGDDKRCQSDLQLQAKFLLTQEQRDGRDIPDTYILQLGNDGVATLDITITNAGEDAHDASLNVTLPPDLDYMGTDDQASCILDAATKRFVVCSLGNPMPGSKDKDADPISFQIRLDPSKLTPSSKYLPVHLQLNTTSDEPHEEDNSRSLKVKVLVHTDIEVRAKSEDDRPEYGGIIRGESAISHEIQIGPQIIHKYEVKNLGNVTISDFSLTVFWPFELKNIGEHGKHVLYVLEPPMIDDGVSDRGKCFIEDKYVNPLKVQLDDAKLLRYQTNSDPVQTYNATQPEVIAIKSTPSESQQQRRAKRDLSLTGTSSSQKTKTLDCDLGTAKCFSFYCEIGQLTARDSVVISVRSRLWNSTFQEEFMDYKHVTVQSKAVLTIPDSLNVEQSDYSNDEAKAETKVVPKVLAIGKEPVALWIIIVSVIAGIILLVVIIVLLWKCGFFQRKKPDDAQKHKAKVEKKKHTHKYKKAYNSYD